MANEAKGFNEVNELIAMVEKAEEERDFALLQLEELEKKEAAIIKESGNKKEQNKALLESIAAVQKEKNKVYNELKDIQAKSQEASEKYNKLVAENEAAKAELQKLRERDGEMDAYLEEQNNTILEQERQLKNIGNKLVKLQNSVGELIEDLVNAAESKDQAIVYGTFGVRDENNDGEYTGIEIEKFYKAVLKSRNLENKQKKDKNFVGETDYQNKLTIALNKMIESRKEMLKNYPDELEIVLRKLDKPYVEKIINKECDKVKGTVKTKKALKIAAIIIAVAAVAALTAFGIAKYGKDRFAKKNKDLTNENTELKDDNKKKDDEIEDLKEQLNAKNSVDLTEDANKNIDKYQDILKTKEQGGKIDNIDKMFYNAQSGRFTITATGYNKNKEEIVNYIEGKTEEGIDDVTSAMIFRNMENGSATYNVYSAKEAKKEVVDDNTTIYHSVSTKTDKESGMTTVTDNAIVYDDGTYYVYTESRTTNDKNNAKDVANKVMNKVSNHIIETQIENE